MARRSLRKLSAWRSSTDERGDLRDLGEALDDVEDHWSELLLELLRCRGVLERVMERPTTQIGSSRQEAGMLATSRG
jgi:hypothetical protein